MVLLFQIAITVVVMAVSVALVVAVFDRVESGEDGEFPGDSKPMEPIRAGHQEPLHLLAASSTVAGLLYTAPLLWLVWDVPWWLAIMAIPLGVLLAFPGAFFYLFGCRILEWFGLHREEP
ncbi:MAG: hypothetical protein ACR2NZ_16660 [Rubripirellula sp.]